jgi:DNA processing protein
MKTQNCIKLADLPDNLKNIPSPPSQLWCKGGSLAEICQQPCLSVVGSRAISPYGKAAIQRLLPEVIRAGVVIVSGLALGTDALAHQAALQNNGLTIAVLPSSVNEVYPVTNRQFADEILAKDGCLISEYPDGTDALRHNFIERNRLVSGLSQAVLIIEAAEKSGTLHTANFALEQGRDVLVVPGNITSAHSTGTNNLIKSGATPVTTSQDILRALGLEDTKYKQQAFAYTEEETTILTLLRKGITETSELLSASEIETAVFNQTLTMLEINGTIAPTVGGKWTIR